MEAITLVEQDPHLLCGCLTYEYDRAHHILGILLESVLTDISL